MQALDQTRALAETLAKDADPKFRNSQFLQFVSKMSRGEIILEDNQVLSPARVHEAAYDARSGTLGGLPLLSRCPNQAQELHGSESLSRDAEVPPCHDLRAFPNSLRRLEELVKVQAGWVSKALVSP